MTDGAPLAPGFTRGYYAEVTADVVEFSARAAKLREPYSETRNVWVETRDFGLTAWFDVPTAEYDARWAPVVR